METIKVKKNGEEVEAHGYFIRAVMSTGITKAYVIPNQQMSDMLEYKELFENYLASVLCAEKVTIEDIILWQFTPLQDSQEGLKIIEEALVRQLNGVREKITSK